MTGALIRLLAHGNHLWYQRLIRWVPVSNKSIRNWLESKRIFFVLACGRSGTQWLANTLNQCEHALVEHEPMPGEAWAYIQAIKRPEAALTYMQNFRLKEIYLRAKSPSDGQQVYGEVNGFLRRHIPALLDTIPGVVLIHLVRNGKNVVRSHVSRRALASDHPVYQQFRPPGRADYAEHWNDLSLFERNCWYWTIENRYIRKWIPLYVRFEDIISSFSAFREQLLDPLGLHMPKPTWQQLVTRPQNVTNAFSMPPWPDWSLKEKKTFEAICGDEMLRYGYAI
ncbi:MAG: hypothetical protein R6V03_10475 [Kiritimatiellia bacterium]